MAGGEREGDVAEVDCRDWGRGGQVQSPCADLRFANTKALRKTTATPFRPCKHPPTHRDNAAMNGAQPIQCTANFGLNPRKHSVRRGSSFVPTGCRP
jgi:hypothetical protein